jgi:hypothetical protein
MVIHAYNPRNLGGRDLQDQFKLSLSKKLARPSISQQTSGTGCYISVISVMQEESRRRAI